jgi:hypothetical protein
MGADRPRPEALRPPFTLNVGDVVLGFAMDNGVPIGVLVQRADGARTMSEETTVEPLTDEELAELRADYMHIGRNVLLRDVARLLASLDAERARREAVERELAATKLVNAECPRHGAQRCGLACLNARLTGDLAERTRERDEVDAHARDTVTENGRLRADLTAALAREGRMRRVLRKAHTHWGAYSDDDCPDAECPIRQALALPTPTGPDVRALVRVAREVEITARTSRDNWEFAMDRLRALLDGPWKGIGE